MPINTNIYSTELSVRPDDIDLFQHVHSSKYIDYVLAARFDQMARCYNFPMQEYLQNNLGWFLVDTSIQFKRPLKMGDTFVVETQIKDITKNIVIIHFQIKFKNNLKISAAGIANYSLIDLQTQKAIPIPQWIVERHSI